MNSDRPGSSLVQIVVSDVRVWRLVTRLLIWVARLLVTWVWQITWLYSNGIVFNHDGRTLNTVCRSLNSCWDMLTSNDLPTCRSNWIDSNILVSPTSKWRGADLVPLVINVSNLAILHIRCVCYVNSNVLLTILNRYRRNTVSTIGNMGRVTGMYWYIYSNPVCSIG